MIVVVFLGTAPAIKQNRATALQNAVFDVLPGAAFTQTYVFSEDNGGALSLLNDGANQPIENVVYAGFDEQKQLIGVALQAHGQGYQDVIRILYGYSPQREQVIGLQVLESRETPGLGDKIDKDSAFLANFAALDAALSADKQSLQHAIEAVKTGEKVSPWQVDGITGATISSVAIADMLNSSAQLWAPRIQKLQGQLRWQQGESNAN